MNIADTMIRVVDCETTGFDPKEHKVVEIAVVDMTMADGIVDGAASLVNPEREIPIDVRAIHHITPEMVATAPIFDAIWPMLRDGGEGEIGAMAAHNAEFDFAFLPTDSPKICTLRIAKHFWPDLEQHKNQYMRYYLGIKVNPDMPTHRALGDATVTALNLQVMLRVAVEEKGILTVEDLIEYVNKPILMRTCRFGKAHYDKPWSAVPKDYLRWMKQNVTDMDTDTLHTVNYWLQRGNR